MSFEENLISLVKEEEYLFNTKSRSYKNATKRAVAWDKISAQLKRPVQGCKQRWRSLRDRFTREHRCMTSLPSGSAAIVEPDDKWELYDSLEFLISSLLTRKQIVNTEVPLAESAAVTASPKKSRGIKRKAAEETFKSFLDGLSTSVVSHLTEPANEDIDLQFMQNMGNKIKRLPELTRIRLHSQIFELINNELLQSDNDK